ncbi:MAG: hypothetical protein V3S36_06370, partial [Acidiferrobacterales bacterium]
MKRISSIKRTVFAGLTALTLALVNIPPAVAAELALTDVPLFIDLAIEPNVVVSLDDSGSMQRCFILDEAISRSSVEDEKGMTAYQVNALAYNPNIKYEVPVDGNGVSLGMPSFTLAWEDGFDPARVGNEKELDQVFAPCWDSLYDYISTPLGAQYAYYHTFSGDPTNDSDVDNQSNYTKVVISAAEEQNFAIWFSYYRSRFITMKSTAGRAFVSSSLGGSNAGDGRIRVAFQGLWGKGGAKGNRKDINIMKLFEGQARVDFFDWLYTKQRSGGTPLRYSVHKAGLYYSNKRIASATGVTPVQPINKPEDSPWAFEPGVTKDPEFTCRQAFHVMLSDGSWNNDEGVSGDIDGNNATYPEALDTAGTLTTYTQFPPYEDSDSETLADNAFEYWVNDLRPDLANDVPAYMPDPTPHPVTGNVEDNPKNDPATWQHMVNFMVGFGVDGDMAVPGDYDALVDGSKQWTGDKVDDMWHAAMNSRGEYLSAKNPDDLVNAFTTALNAVLARTGSGSAVALNSGSLEAGSRLFQGRFKSGTWTGQVLAFDLNASTGAVASSESWDAAPLLTARVQGGGGSGWDT